MSGQERMSIAVIGASGQLGSDLMGILGADRRYRVEGFGRSDLDVRDGTALEQKIARGKFDAVLNCAAITNVDQCEEHGDEAVSVNATGAYLVARACSRAGSRHVYISTDFVFDGEQEDPYDESARPAPVNIYGASKLSGELLAQVACPRGLVLRISSVFGKAGSRGKGGNFVETILQRARAGERLRVVDDITMSPTYTVDVVRAVGDLLEAGATGVVHASNRGSCTWFEFASEALSITGVGAHIEPVSSQAFPRPARRPRNSALSSRRLSALTGREMPGWRDALREYLAEKGHLSRGAPHRAATAASEDEPEEAS